MGSSLYSIASFCAVFGHGIGYCPRHSKTKTCTSYSGWKMIWNSQLSSKHSDVRCRRYSYQLPHQTLGPMPSWCPSQRKWRSHWSPSRGKPVISEWPLTRKALFAEHSLSIAHFDDFQHASVSVFATCFWAWLYQWHMIMPARLPASMMQKCDIS